MTIKVLIVDDEPINVKLIEDILDYESEFQYRTAMNGDSALTILNDYCPDIIILDIMMPGMNGYEVCRQIKNSDNYKFTKVLMVSGKTTVEERLKGYEAGADDYITKPFIDDELLAKLKVFSKLKKTEEIDELKTGILQLFSHETKTPLNGILLGSQLIIDSPSPPEKVKEYAKLIKTSGERLHNLVHKILLLSNLKNNRSLNLQAQSVASYLGDLVKQTEHLSKHNCQIDIDCPSEFVLELDWKLFHEAVSAVVDNGIKFSPENGTVSITTTCEESNVNLMITDQGPGINPLLLDKIFDEFYSQEIEKHSKGTALSLAIAKKIMKIHGGNLNAESIPGEGATFIFTLPLSSVVQ